MNARFLKTIVALAAVLSFTFSAYSSYGQKAGVHPEGKISTSELSVRFYIPDAVKGFYQGTRFDWSGLIYSLIYKGEEYYGPWYTSIDPSIYNNVQRVRPDGTGEVVTGIASSGMGPSEEFLTNDKALGFDEAKPGETFLKIGVGILRRPDEKEYDRYRAYEIVNGGRWSTKIYANRVVFTQILTDKASSYGYIYTKTITLIPGKPMMRIDHVLRNTGTKKLVSSVYDHNFFVTKNHHTGSDYMITMQFPIKNSRPIPAELARIEGNKMLFLKPFGPKDMVVTEFEGFGSTSADYNFSVEKTSTGTGYTVQGDRPMSNIMLWAIFTNISMESFIDLLAEPGKEEKWSYEYTYFTSR